MTFAACAVSLLLHAAAPASSPDAPAKPPAAPGAVKQLFDREAAPRPPVSFEFPGGLKGKVEAAKAPGISAEEKSLKVDFGTAEAMTCTYTADRAEPGAMVARMAEALRKSFKLVGLAPTGIVAAAGSALVFVELVYQQESAKGPLVGHIKVAVYAHDTRSFFCIHDEPGYAATFRRMVQGLAESLEGGGADEREAARRAELVILKLGNLIIGFDERVTWARQGGGRVTVGHSSMLMPRTQSELVLTDGFTQELSAEDGLLDSGVYVHALDGEVDFKMKLDRTDDKTGYAFKGEKAGKPLQGTFAAKDGLATDLWFARRFDAKAGYGPAGEVKHDGYSYEGNPVGPVAISYKKDPARPRGVEMSFGPVRLVGTLDEHGFLSSGEMPMGPTSMAIERVMVRGAP